MLAMKVLKIGGNCLRDKDTFQRVVTMICSEENQIPVVSALYGVTEMLRNGIQKAIFTEKSVPKVIASLREIHSKIAETCISDTRIRERTLESIDLRLDKLERLLYGIAYTEELSENVRSTILSYGERLSAILLAGIITDHGKEAVAMESDKIGLFTDDYPDNATADLPLVRKNFQHSVLPVVNAGKIPVITGYFGCTEEGKITTFGPNGTDYSAAVVANALGAERLEIWKDVDGFMTSDPGMVKEARRIEQLSYYEAAELSYFGAHILHPRTVEPLNEPGIPIYIRNIYQPESEGTKIHSVATMREGVIKSVTYNDKISVLRIFGAGVGYKPGIISDIGNNLSERGINIYSIITSQTCINLLLDEKDSKESLRAVRKLAGDIIGNVTVEEDIALIAVVGEGLLETKGLAAKVFSAVADQEINVEMLSGGASKVAYYFIVKDRDVERALKAIHKVFFG